MKAVIHRTVVLVDLARRLDNYPLTYSVAVVFFRSTYNHLSSWLTDTRNLTNPSTVIFLIGNKSDLDGQRDVTYEEAKQFADENGLMFVEASAKT